MEDPNIPPSQWSPYACLRHLLRTGWRHEMVSAADSKTLVPYRKGSEKVFYSKCGNKTIPKGYALALACSDNLFQRGAQVIQHLLGDKFYKKLFEDPVQIGWPPVRPPALDNGDEAMPLFDAEDAVAMQAIMSMGRGRRGRDRG